MLIENPKNYRGLVFLLMYYALTDDCKVYRISISESQSILLQVMCPNKKLVWFQQNPDWHDEDRIESRKVIIDWWTESYAVPEVTPGPTPAPSDLSTMTDSDSIINAEVGRRGSLY